MVKQGVLASHCHSHATIGVIQSNLRTAALSHDDWFKWLERQ